MSWILRKIGDSGSVSAAKGSRLNIKNKPKLLEETQFDGRPIRKYVDGSVKAATSEGWMSFSDFEEFQAYAHWRKIRRSKKIS